MANKLIKKATKKLKKTTNPDVAVDKVRTIIVKDANSNKNITVKLLVQNKIKYTPKISIIIPVYNVEEYLGECLDSVLKQTLSEIEIICVDDGSTDKSLEILKEYAKQDNRITVLKQKNAGSGKARNLGIYNARGEFVAFMDSDDMYPNEKTLEHIYNAAKKNNVLVCGGSLSQLREGGEIVTDPKEFEEGYSFAKAGIVEYSEYQFDYGYWRFIYNRNFLKKNMLFFPDYLRQQDPPFFVKTMAAAGKFYALPEPTYVYRVSYKQIKWNERKTIDLFKGMRDCLIYSKQYNLNQLHSRIAQRLNIWTFRTAAATMVDNKNVRQQVLETLDAVDNDILKKENISLELDDIYKAIIQAKDHGVIVSVIIPCYNVEKYLPRCLDSIINQTFKSIEIICVNDGSPDNSLEILEEYARQDNRIRIVNKKNGGLSSARNAGVPEARGFFINFIDSDDWIDITTIEKAVTKMSGPIDLVCYGAEIVNEGLDQYNSGIYVGKEYHKIKVTGQRQMTEDVILNSSYTVWNKLFKTHIIKDFGLKFAEGRLFEDNDYSIMYMMHCRSGYYLNEYLYYYVQRPGSIMERVRARESNKTVDHLYIFNNIYEHAVKYKLSNFTQVLNKRFLMHLRMAYQFAPESDKPLIRQTAYNLFKKADEDYITAPELKLIKHKNFDLVRELNEIIVSLTSYPARIGTIHLVIESLLNQSMRADRVILWLAPEQFPNKESDLPQELLDLQAKGLTIGWYKDIRSYKKLIPTLKLYPNSIIVTADDDNIYQKHWLKKLFDSYVKHPGDIQAHRVTKFYYANNRFYTVSGGRSYYKDASYLNKLVGLGGVLYPPHCFYKDILNEDLIKKLAPTNDDQWFWLQAAMNGVKVRVVDNPDIDAHYVEGTQETGLTNINDNGENLFWKDFNNILAYYPQIFDILLEEHKKNLSNIHNDSPYKEELLEWYKRTQNSELNLYNPKTFNEKIQWSKLYDSTPIKTLLADKYLVRDWVKEKIGEEYLIPLLGVYDSFDEIDFEKLPKQFVIKCNHGCAYNIIVKDKSQLDLNDVKSKLNRWMNENFAFKFGLELQYRDIKPKIIIEQFIENEEADDLYDYKFYCFNGKPTYVQFISDRKGLDIKQSFYDMDWQKQSFYNNNQFDPRIKQCPVSFQKMKELAAVLSKGFPFVRVDFYQMDNGDIYFGEMTFSPATGIMKWNSEEVNLKLGKMIKLPQKAYNLDTGKYYKTKKPSVLKAYLLFPYYLYKIKKMNAIKKEKIDNLLLKQLLGARIDIKNYGNAKNSVEIEGDNIKTLAPKWFSDTDGIGKTIDISELTNKIKLKIINSGKLVMIFRGQDTKYDGKRIPVWTDYKSIKIDGKELLSEPVITWHDKPYKYEMSVKDGQEITLEVEQRYHEYPEDELKDIILKLNSTNGFIKDNISQIVSTIHKKDNVACRQLTTLPRIEADCFVSLGFRCQTAYQLREHHLRYCSLPFDWLYDCPLSIFISTLQNGISSWLKSYKEEHPKEQTHRHIRDCGNNMILMHDFPLEQSIEEYMPRFKEKYNRRINRLIKIVNESEKICIVCSDRQDNDVILCNFIKQLHKLYPQKVLHLLHVKHSDTEKSIKEYSIDTNATVYCVRANNIHRYNGNGKDPMFWIGNEDLWDDICKHLFLSEKIEKNIIFDEILSNLTAFRIDIKNYGTKNNNVDVSATDLKINEPKWFADEQGIGKTVEGCNINNNIKIKAIGDGLLKINFRGQDKRFEDKHIPVWIDYKSIKVDGKELLAEPVATWHDKPYTYETHVKNDQEIVLEVEQQYHKYTEDQIMDMLVKLYPNDIFVKNNIIELFNGIQELFKKV